MSDHSDHSERMTLEVAGMSCASCVHRVESAIRRVPGVRDAQVNLVSRRATITYDAHQVDVDQVVAAIRQAGYEGTPARSVGQGVPHVHGRDDAHPGFDPDLPHLRRQVVMATIASVPIVAIAMSHGVVVGGWSSALIQAVLATVVIAGPGRGILAPALTALRHGAADMNTLVSMGVLAAWGYSVTVLVLASRTAHDVTHLPLYFEAAAVIITVVLIGKLLEARSRGRLTDAVAGLVSLRPIHARRIDDGQDEVIPLDQLRSGDRLLIRPGERFPADGTVEDGSSTIDASLITGESMPEDIGVGSAIREGTLNQTGVIRLHVTALGADAALGRIITAVEQAQGNRAPIARLADRISAVFVPVIIGIALITAGCWVLIDHSPTGIGRAMEHAIAVLVIACPCALGLATPAAVAVGTGRAAVLGILFKGGAAVEAASRITTVFLDKTGTLTTGTPVVSDLIACPPSDEQTLLRIAASAERGSEHPLAQAIIASARQRGLSLTMPTHVIALPGQGLRAIVDGQSVHIGTARWLSDEGLSSGEATAAADRLARAGRTPVLVAVDRRTIGAVGLLDQPSPAAREAVVRLRRTGIALAMVTGDRVEAAQAVAGDLGITEIHAEVTPEGKAQVVAQAQSQGQVVAMVGDGLNDAPALAGADVGIAVGHGTDVAQAAADIVLVHGISGVPIAIDLARRTMSIIRQNLVWAFIYNVAGVPIAAGVLEPLTGWTLSPMIASMAMALSSVSVLMNSLRLKGQRTSH